VVIQRDLLGVVEVDVPGGGTFNLVTAWAIADGIRTPSTSSLIGPRSSTPFLDTWTTG